MLSILGRAELILFNPDRRIAALALAGLLVLGAFVAALLVAVAGPVYAVAAFLVVCGGLLVLRDIRWGFVALFAVIGLLPFAALPFKLGFTPTFLDVALLALFTVWLIRVATRREPRLVGSALGIPLLIFSFWWSLPSRTVCASADRLRLPSAISASWRSGSCSSS
jgi:hypothetical protein